jgi:ribosomal protein S19
MKRLTAAGILMVFSVAPVLMADPPKPPANTSVPPIMQEAMVKTMVDLVARSVARRYDLRPDQADVARQMLEKNTTQFLNTHYNDLLVIIPQMQETRMRVMNGQELSATEVKAMAAKVLPIYKEATDLIVSENDKFHEILDDNQKVKHQLDMSRMKQDVGQTMEKLDRWKEGGYKPGEFFNNRTRRQQAEMKTPAEEEKLTDISISTWELYVKEFIKAFQLEPGQIPMAYTVLNDIKAKAKAYRDDHAREFIEARQSVHRLERVQATQPTQAKELKQARQKLADLEKPLNDMFEELRQRLMAIPTEEQRKAALEALPDGKPGEAKKAGQAGK